MKFNRQAESDGGSLSKLVVIIITAVVVFSVGYQIVNFGDKSGESISGLDNSIECKIDKSKCETNSLKLNEEESYEAIEDFAKTHSIEKAKLLAFISVESSSKAFDGKHPTVRFECIKFNNKSSEDVPCDIDSKNKYGIQEHTNLQAFNRALEVNREEALMSSSYGLGQVMGFNYVLAGYDSVEDYYSAMFEEENQVRAFLNFLMNRDSGVILAELKEDDTNWELVAQKYNGDDYKSNNYDTRLERAYERYS